MYCLLGFETLKDLEFRNREGEFKRETTSALNRRSRGGLALLLSVRDAFPKVLIARTRHGPYIREGVLVLDLARWLLGEQGF